MTKLRELERLRGYAVLLIVFYHQATVFNIKGLFQYTWAGVDLFFVLSGFVISLSLTRILPELQEDSSFVDRLDRSRSALQVFYMRRMGRILPQALLWASICFVIALIENQYQIEILKEIFAIFTLQYNYAIPHGLGQLMVEYWSLNVEEHFYLFLPFFFVIVPSRSKRLKWSMLLIILVVFILRPFAMEEKIPLDLRWAYLRFSSHLRLDALMAGVVIQLIRSYGWGDSLARIPRRVIQAICLFSLLGLFLQPCLMPADYVSHHGSIALWIFSGILVFFASFDKNFVLSFQGSRNFFEYLGTRSFGIYLIHRPAGYLVYLLNSRLLHSAFLEELIPKLTFNWLLILLLAEVSRKWIELPGIHWSRKLTTVSVH